MQFVTTYLLFASQSTVDLAKSSSDEEIISLDLRNSQLAISSRMSQTLTPRRRTCGIHTRWHRVPPSPTDPSNPVSLATEAGLASQAHSGESPSLTRFLVLRSNMRRLAAFSVISSVEPDESHLFSKHPRTASNTIPSDTVTENSPASSR